MPDIAAFHPPIIHIVIGFLVAGVGLRVLSLIPRLSWASPAATTLIVLGALATIPAVESGTQAHGPAERVPGAREAVVEHEEWGERTRNLFLAIAAIELVALAVGRNPNRKKLAQRFRMATAAIGLVGMFVLYETGEHGGHLVYGYAGGVGLRSGDSADVTHLLIAGLYHQAMLDRRDGDAEGAGRLIEELRRRDGGDPSVQLMAAESLVRDQKDPRAALEYIATLDVAADDARLAPRVGLLRADAYEALGLPDSASAIVQDLATRFPQSRAVQQRMDQMK
ncbi:MAG: hypothetical protein PVH00_01300 [Gemmatimonadota bacterium]